LKLEREERIWCVLELMLPPEIVQRGPAVVERRLTRTPPPPRFGTSFEPRRRRRAHAPRPLQRAGTERPARLLNVVSAGLPKAKDPAGTANARNPGGCRHAVNRRPGVPERLGLDIRPEPTPSRWVAGLPERAKRGPCEAPGRARTGSQTRRQALGPARGYGCASPPASRRAQLGQTKTRTGSDRQRCPRSPGGQAGPGRKQSTR